MLSGFKVVVYIYKLLRALKAKNANIDTIKMKKDLMLIAVIIDIILK